MGGADRWFVQVRTSLATAAGKYEDSDAHVSRGGFFVTWTRERVSDGRSTIVRVDVDGDDEAALLPWTLGVEANDLSLAKSGPTRDLVIFESNGRGDPDATFVDIGTFPILCNRPKQCAKQIVWLTEQQGERQACRQPAVVTRRPRLRLQPPEERHEQGLRHLDGELRHR